MEELTLIANSGIQMFTFSIEIDLNTKFEKCFREWHDDETNTYNLSLLHRMKNGEEDEDLYYNKRDLYYGGYLASTQSSIEKEDLDADGIAPLNGAELEGLFKMKFSDKDCCLDKFENQWLPLPYYYRPSPTNPSLFRAGAFNWARCKLIPITDPVSDEGKKKYTVLLAFDTRTQYENDRFLETPAFTDPNLNEMHYAVCADEVLLLDYCSRNSQHSSYVDNYILSLVYPDLFSIEDIKGKKGHKMGYIVSYYLLVNYIATNGLFPPVKLFKDQKVEEVNIDMIVDIGNSRTTALLKEGHNNCSFKDVSLLELQDWSNPVIVGSDTRLNRINEPFDMRVAFHKVNFGDISISGSHQFVYPSMLRLGREANRLIHEHTSDALQTDTLSTYSSPKRYLWDSRPSRYEWCFLTSTSRYRRDHILNIPGITEWLNDDGTLNVAGEGGGTHHYSRRSLMTFSFLEMLTQANIHVNRHEYRKFHGDIQKPRRIKRLIITCPTTMSEVERKALVRCAKDAAFLALKFFGFEAKIDVVPAYVGRDGEDQIWYYDEATCSQLVYMYGEIGHKYKGYCDEFFNLYGKKKDSKSQLTVASLDIGAGTSDLMICRYEYQKDLNVKITPEPIFYDSFYHAGDDMMKALIRELVARDSDTDLRLSCSALSDGEFHQKVKDFFGPDHANQSVADRLLRHDFNIQVSVPLMNYYLQLLSNDSNDCVVHYQDVFGEVAPNPIVLEGFKNHFGIDLSSVDWHFNKAKVSAIVANSFDPLLKMVAAIAYSNDCDMFILSGRPSSLPVIRELFLGYHTVSADRLINLNNYYVGEWYPFGNNTGYIKNPKTVVAIGAMIGYYSSEFSAFDTFALDTSKLKEKLKSTTNYVLNPIKDSSVSTYCLTENIHNGTVILNTIPAQLEVRNIDFETYPTRPLFVIDYNYRSLERKVERNYPGLSREELMLKRTEEIDKLQKQLPIEISLERQDPSNKEGLDVIDPDGNDKVYVLRVQSLGTNENYWLDTGIFEF